MLEPQTEQPSQGVGRGESGAETIAFQLKKGLDLPISGAPEQTIEDGPAITSCAVVGTDYHELKPKMMVAEGDTVRLGQTLFADRRFEGVVYTSPASGRIRAINRGPRRVLESLVIDIDSKEDPVSFARYDADEIRNLDRARIKENLLASGLWTALRTRPYSWVPDPESVPAAIFVTAMDSGPLAPDAAVVIREAPEDFSNGVGLLSKLTDGATYLCHRPDAEIPGATGGNILRATFEGPHPAGLAGTHIHHLDPVHAEKTVWHINYQDVMAVGALFRSGHLPTERVISIAGPAAKRPRLLRSRVGASTATLVEGETIDAEVRVIAGNVLTGRTAIGSFAYLGRFHQQITLMEEGRKRELFGWLVPSMRKFATANVHFSSLFGRGTRFPFNTSLNGSPRAMVPVGLYEDMMPLDVLPTQLLRALLILDTEDAQALGCLELDEEDLALCSYVCLSKYEYGMALRANLKKIEAEG